MHFDPLIGWELEIDHVSAAIGYRYPNFHLPDFGEPDWLRRRYRDACNRARQVTAAADSLDEVSVSTRVGGKPFTLRWVMLHLIEETARHAGHADLLREAIDGTTGE